MRTSARHKYLLDELNGLDQCPRATTTTTPSADKPKEPAGDRILAACTGTARGALVNPDLGEIVELTSVLSLGPVISVLGVVKGHYDYARTIRQSVMVSIGVVRILYLGW